MGRFSFCRLSPRSPLPCSPRPVATFATCAAIRGIAKPPVWPVSAKPSRVARVGSGRACDWLQVYQPLSGEQLKMCAGWGVHTSRPVATVVPRYARVAPCCSSLTAFQSAQAVACARADAAYIRAHRASGCWQRHFWNPHALGYAVHGLCSRPSPWPSFWPSLGRPRSSPARSTSGPAPPRTSRLVLAVARPSPLHSPSHGLTRQTAATPIR